MIKNCIISLINKVVKPLKIKEFNAEIFVPDEENFGHYSTNAALRLAKLVKRPPLEIAEEIKSGIKKNALPKFFEKIEIAPPGFINFWLSEKTLQDELRKILKSGARYGRLKTKNYKLKTQIEYISANPTGPLTLANGRGGFFGDVLANILEHQGFQVEREYYVNDTGNQIITLGKSILASVGLLPQEENFYKGGYIKEWADANSTKIKKFQNNPLKLGQSAARDFLTAIKKVIKKTGIKFDRFTSEERDIHKKKFIPKILDIFKKAGLTYENEGALWLKTSSFGDDKDRVLITGDGFPTYFLADAGHYLETKTRGFTNKINILGPDHYGYVKRIQAVAKIVGLKRSECLVTQAVRLKDGKMSKRKGTFIAFEDLIDEVGADVARFFFLMYSPDTHMNFDLGLAKERSLKNPVYYVQYAYVRCGSILRKLKTKNEKVKITDKNFKLNLLNTKTDFDLIHCLARFPEIIEDISKNYQIHNLTSYALELARGFHNFYEKERVIADNKDLSHARLALVKAVQIVLKKTLELLRITLPKKM